MFGLRQVVGQGAEMKIPRSIARRLGWTLGILVAEVLFLLTAPPEFFIPIMLTAMGAGMTVWCWPERRGPGA